MFQIFQNDGTRPVPNDDVVYIIGKKGLFLKKRVGIVESIAPVKEVSFLEDVNLYAKLHIRKIPSITFARIVDFFKRIYQLHHSECISMLMYNIDTQKYKIYIPHQKVTGASLDYIKPLPIEGYIKLCTIHSHASMGAFHSGTDDTDEEHFDGLHITIGNLDEEDFSISASVVVNGHRFKVNPAEYIENICPVDENENLDWKKWTGATDLKRRLRWKISGVRPSKRKCNEKWLSYVTKYVPEVSHFNFADYEYGFGDSFGAFGYMDNLGIDGIDRFINRRELPNSIIPIETKNKDDKTPINVNIMNSRGIRDYRFSRFRNVSYPSVRAINDVGVVEHESKKESPCSKCVFKNVKILEEMRSLKEGGVSAEP